MTEEGVLEKKLKIGEWFNRKDSIEEFYIAGSLISKIASGRYFHRNGYSILFPVGWKKGLERSSVVGFLPQERMINKVALGESISVISGNIPDTLSFEQYIEKELRGTQALLGSFRIQSRNINNRGDIRSASFVVHGLKDSIPVTTMLSIFLKDKKLVVVTCLSPDSYLTDDLESTFKKVLSSVRFDNWM